MPKVGNSRWTISVGSDIGLRPKQMVQYRRLTDLLLEWSCKAGLWHVNYTLFHSRL